MGDLKKWDSPYSNPDSRRDKYLETMPDYTQDKIFSRDFLRSLEDAKSFEASFTNGNVVVIPNTTSNEKLTKFIKEHRLVRINSYLVTEGYAIKFKTITDAALFRLYYPDDTISVPNK